MFTGSNFASDRPNGRQQGGRWVGRGGRFVGAQWKTPYNNPYGSKYRTSEGTTVTGPSWHLHSGVEHITVPEEKVRLDP